MSEDMNEHTPRWTPDTVEALLKEYGDYSVMYAVKQLASALTWALEQRRLFEQDAISLNSQLQTCGRRREHAEAERDAAKARAESAHELLIECYGLLERTYTETSSAPDEPPGPADEWSYNLIPMFTAIQNATGKHHGEIMDALKEAGK